MKFLDETEADDPILSVVNLIDVFLVVIAALLITVAQNPLLSPFSKQDVTVITDAGKPTMEVIQKRVRARLRQAQPERVGKRRSLRQVANQPISFKNCPSGQLGASRPVPFDHPRCNLQWPPSVCTAATSMKPAACA